ncbi:MAG: hypothetical protein D3926_03550 [Desulfobacteraceae bacterium]|nr:MAG: hypothetical protein D3926_03550 [Desulfobacteraceae bacterium]
MTKPISILIVPALALLVVLIHLPDHALAGPGLINKAVRIGTRTGGEQVCLEHDAKTGNLFAVVRFTESYPSGNTYIWTVNISKDRGRTWQETFVYQSTFENNDISTAVAGGYLWVGYTTGFDLPDKVFMRRFKIEDGLHDTTYGGPDGFQLIIDKSRPVNDIEVITYQDSTAVNVYRVFVAAILDISASHSANLVLYNTIDISTATPAWTEWDTGVTNALDGLSGTWNNNYYKNALHNFCYLTYIAATGQGQPVMILKMGASGLIPFQLEVNYDGLNYNTSVSAWNDTVICAYEKSWNGTSFAVAYDISYDGGIIWSTHTWSPTGSEYYLNPSVTAKGGYGTAIAMNHSFQYISPAHLSFSQRQGYAGGAWEEPFINPGNFMWPLFTSDLDWLPPLPGSEYAWGITYLALTSGWETSIPHFVRLDHRRPFTGSGINLLLTD